MRELTDTQIHTEPFYPPLRPSAKIIMESLKHVSLMMSGTSTSTTQNLETANTGLLGLCLIFD